MKSKFLMTLRALFPLAAMLTFTACFYSGPGYGPYGYGSGPAYVGEYDENRTWHDRDWWVDNHHDWTHEHHPEWVANETHEEHEQHVQHDHHDQDHH